MNKKVKERKTRIPKSYDITMIGDEPIWNKDVEATQGEIVRALNWYNYFYNGKTAYNLLKKNYVRNLRELKLLDMLLESEISPTLCYISRMISLGCKLPAKSRENFDLGIEKLLTKARKIKSEREIKEKSVNVITIQDRVLSKARDYMGEFEYQIDEFLKNKCKSTFSAYEYLSSNEVKPMIARKMVGVYDDLILELKETLEKKDLQLVEGWSNLKPLQIRKYIAFLEGIQSDILTYTKNGKRSKRVRRKKVVTAAKQIEKLQYMKSFVELKLQSVDPNTVIGANQLWTYNTKYKKLTKFVSENSNGFSIKGTTLQNYSETESCCKRLRKPKEILTKVQNGGKIVLRKLMDELTTKGEVPKGRINKDTILLRTIK